MYSLLEVAEQRYLPVSATSYLSSALTSATAFTGNSKSSLECAADTCVRTHFMPSPHGQDRVVAGHASSAVAYNDREEAAVIGCDRRWSGVGRAIGSRDVHAVFAPLIVQRGGAGRPYPKCGCLSYIDCRIGRLSCDRGRDRCRR